MGTLSTSGDSGELAVLTVAGADARQFLQGQLSNDLRLLTRDNSQLAALNTPQGRVVAVVRSFERADVIHAILPRSLLAAAMERLRKYVLRSKVTLTAADEQRVTPLTGEGARRIGANPAAQAKPCTAIHRERDGVSCLVYVDSIPRALLIGAPDKSEQFLAETGATASTWNDWRLAQITAGEPQVYAATSEHFVAQMLNLDLIEGLSFTKGCYTGQEIIVRTQHLGRIKRRMQRFQHAAADSSPGDKLIADEASVGEVVDRATRADGSVEMLAVVQLARPTQAPTLPGATPIAPLDLPYPFEAP